MASVPSVLRYFYARSGWISQAPSQNRPMGRISSSDAQRESIRSRLTECDREIEHYKKLLLAGTDANLVAGWINQSQAERVLLERDLVAIPESLRLSNGQVAHIVSELGTTVVCLEGANPEQRQKLYAAFGLRLTYKPDTGIVLLESRPIACTQVSVGGASSGPTPTFRLIYSWPAAA